MTQFIIMTSTAIDQALMNAGFSDSTMLPREVDGLVKVTLGPDVIGYRTKAETAKPYFAMISVECLETLFLHGVKLNDAYRRIARVVSSMQSPPVHLPRQWSEYHFKNLITFFAASRDVASYRWIVEINGDSRVAKFDFLSSDQSEVSLQSFTPLPWPQGYTELIQKLLAYAVDDDVSNDAGLASEVDLSIIGSASVVQGLTYEAWSEQLTKPQKDVVNESLDKSIRIVGPAGSGKTLSLCMRALRVARDERVIAQEKKILVATHSWAMSERIDGVLSDLNGGVFPDRITVYPLLSLLDLHVGSIGQKRIDVIGDDSSDGRRKTISILQGLLGEPDRLQKIGISNWISDGIAAKSDSRARLDLVGYLYEEISGILSATGVSPDDGESVRSYLYGPREDWMPPFALFEDRVFVFSVYESLLKELIDREAITTDQFILDSIRVLETFSWRMRKETEGYDFIFVDELQLFDPQERAVLELLARSKRGVPFVTAEDPSQGVFSSLNGRHNTPADETVYLDTVHRFNRDIFEFISFIYRKFPLNATPLRADHNPTDDSRKPKVITCENSMLALESAAEETQSLTREAKALERICIATLGDCDTDLAEKLVGRGLNVTRLSGFDDIEQLSYSKKSIVVSPWEYVGGTQFSYVIVVTAGISPPLSQFSRLREMISVYLSCSRAKDRLIIVCDSYVPNVLLEACELGFAVKEKYAGAGTKVRTRT